MKTLDARIGFIGAGNMAEAMIGALIASGTVTPSDLMAVDVNAERLSALKRAYTIRTDLSMPEVVDTADIVVLSVKPQVMPGVLDQLRACLPTGRTLIISVAAGISLARIESALYQNLDTDGRAGLPIVRVMPNTPCLVLEGMSGFCMNDQARPGDADTTRTILESMGRAVSVTEEQMDAVTAVSGSGPAYFFHMIEAMVEAGTALGLSYSSALTLSVQTMKGAAKLLENSSDSPEILRKKVTSPGGTTEAALRSLSESGFRESIVRAVSAAARRSKELSA
ncbi:pyrroline-5-carboxylate reductase [Desulfatiferula olefinivorans]